MKLRSKLLALFRKEKLDAEMAEEMRLHLELQAAENEQRGMDPDEARHAAQRQFGGAEQIKERCRDQRGFPWIDQLGQDLRYAGRQLRRSPGFSAVAILTLALGIGACTAIFSVINGVLIHPLDFPEPERLMVLRESGPPGIPDLPVSPPNFIDWEKRLKSFECVAAFTRAAPSFTGGREPLQLSALKVTARYFDVYGQRPLLGRAFLAGDCAPGKDHVVIVSHGFWQRALGAPPDILGRTLQLDGEPYTIVGVAPPGFDLIQGLDAWLPLSFAPELRAEAARGYTNLSVLARLRGGVSASQANTELHLVAAQLRREHPNGSGAFAMPVFNYIVRDLRTVLFTLLGAVGCVLLIACANLSNLLLARAGVRQRELSVRAALGASCARLVRQLLTESLMLAGAGGIAGIVLGTWGLNALLALAPASLPRLHDAQLDARVLAGSLALSLVTGLLFGLAPAWIAARTNVNEALKRSSTGSTDAGARRGLRSVLVVFEIAASLVLLIGAGLLTRSFVELTHVGPGFTIKNATALSLSLPERKYRTPEQRLAFADALLAKVGGLPGVSHVGLTNALPLMGGPVAGFYVEGRPPAIPSDGPITLLYAVTPDYFRAMGVRLLRGRVFSTQDDASAPRVVIINQTFARQQFPDEDPIGKRVWLAAGGGLYEIVGVVADIAQPGFERLTTAQAYDSFAQFAQWAFFSSRFNLVVRTAGPSAMMTGLLRPAVYAVDKDQPVGGIRPFDQLFADLVARERFANTLLGVFSLVALLIAVVGIYGVMAYNVTQRTTEIGIRLALGATPRDVLQLIFGYAGRLIGLGVLLGLAGAMAAARALESMLYHVSGHDPLTLGTVVLVFAGAGALACLVPARRATRVDPMVALRCE